MMGLQDELKLIEIKNFANSIGDYDFIIDDRNQSTSIMIHENGDYFRYSHDWSKSTYDFYRDTGYRHFVPDLVDYHKKVIIEYQESAKKTGKHTIKGHDALTDEDKDLYYQLAGFKQIKVWDYDIWWKNTIARKLDQRELML